MSNVQKSVDSGLNRVSEAVVLAEPEPAFTDSWRPFSHAKILDAMKIAVKGAGLDVVNREYSIRPGSKMMAAWEIGTGEKDFNFGISILNSIDKTHSVTLGAFEKIFICSNFCFRMEYERVMFRRHSGNLEFEEIVFLAKEALKILVPKFKSLRAWHLDLMKTKINAEQSSLITLAAAQRNLLPPSQIPTFFNLFNGPESKYKETSGTLHAWHGAATELMNSNSLLGIAWKQDQLNYYLDYEVPAILRHGKDAVIDLKKVEKEGFVVYQKAREERKAETSAQNKEIRAKFLAERDAEKIAERAKRKAEKAAKKEERAKERAERKAAKDAKRAEREAKKQNATETTTATIQKTDGESITSGKNVKGARAAKKADVPKTDDGTSLPKDFKGTRKRGILPGDVPPDGHKTPLSEGKLEIVNVSKKTERAPFLKPIRISKKAAETDEAPLTKKEKKIAEVVAKVKTEKIAAKEFKARRLAAQERVRKNPDILKIKSRAEFPLS